MNTLTNREQEVMRLVAEGLRMQEIAERLCIALSTAKQHEANIRFKLGLHTRVQVALYAVRNGMVEV